MSGAFGPYGMLDGCRLGREKFGKIDPTPRKFQRDCFGGFLEVIHTVSWRVRTDDDCTITEGR